MLERAGASLGIGIFASLLGFSSTAGVPFANAKVIAVIFLVLFVVFPLLAWGIGAGLFATMLSAAPACRAVSVRRLHGRSVCRVA